MSVKGPLSGLEDLYMAILYPKAIGQGSDYVLFRTGSKAYLQNAGLDSDQDGLITKAEAVLPVYHRLERVW